jgi:hypothetical protein
MGLRAGLEYREWRILKDKEWIIKLDQVSGEREGISPLLCIYITDICGRK